jgi:hypothetical protein
MGHLLFAGLHKYLVSTVTGGGAPLPDIAVSTLSLRETPLPPGQHLMVVRSGSRTGNAQYLLLLSFAMQTKPYYKSFRFSRSEDAAKLG